MHIVVVGAGYVGLTTSACLAALGHSVMCADIDAEKVSELNRGVVALCEPDLPGLVRAGLRSGMLQFVTEPANAFRRPPDMVFVCVPTPLGPAGVPELTAIDAAVTAIAPNIPVDGVLVVKSTTPLGTSERIQALLKRPDVAVVVNPEFLREGSAVTDFMNPGRIVIGSHDPHGIALVDELYRRLGSPIVCTDPASAELAKLAANWFLAMKLSYVNSIATLCDKSGGDIRAVVETIGLDDRIGQHYLRSGPGWGGPCLPKDVGMLCHVAAELEVDIPLMAATQATNVLHQEFIVEWVRTTLGGSLSGASIAVLGLAFKAGTADTRSSPATNIAEQLVAAGARVTAWDPVVRSVDPLGIAVLADPYEAATGASALLLLTECNEFRGLDWKHMASALDGEIVMDLRNHLNPLEIDRVGLNYVAFGIARRSRQLSVK